LTILWEHFPSWFEELWPRAWVEYVYENAWQIPGKSEIVPSTTLSK
jgi:hypothetical protein